MKIIEYKTKEEWLSLRLEDVTSTEVSALFGLNPYMTEYELWHLKKRKQIVEFSESERMKWGTRLENSIALGIAEDNGWESEEFKKYIRHDTIRAGSSFDHFVKTYEGEGILEIKNVDGLIFKNKWQVDGDRIEAPPHIEMQAQFQMMVSGKEFVYIGALVGGNRTVLVRREPAPIIIEAMTNKINKFWESIDNNDPPLPDYERDADMIAQLYNYAEPDSTIEASDKVVELVDKYQLFSDYIKDYEKKKKATKAEILEIIGDAEKVIHDSFSISAGVTGPTVVEKYEKKGFRNFRVNKRTPKK